MNAFIFTSVSQILDKQLNWFGYEDLGNRLGKSSKIIKLLYEQNCVTEGTDLLVEEKTVASAKKTYTKLTDQSSALLQHFFCNE